MIVDQIVGAREIAVISLANKDQGIDLAAVSLTADQVLSPWLP